MIKSFKCCKNKEFANFCCVTCHGIFHSSCLERARDAQKISGHKIYCSDTCKTRAIEDDEKDQKFEDTITKLQEAIKEKDNYIARLKCNSQIFEEDVTEAEQKYTSQLNKQNNWIKDLKDKIKELEICNKKLLEENQTAANIKDKLSQEIADLTSLNKSMIVSIATLEKENEMSVCDIKKLNMEIDKLTKAVLKDNCETSYQSNKSLIQLQETTMSKMVENILQRTLEHHLSPIKSSLEFLRDELNTFGKRKNSTDYQNSTSQSGQKPGKENFKDNLKNRKMHNAPKANDANLESPISAAVTSAASTTPTKSNSTLHKPKQKQDHIAGDTEVLTDNKNEKWTIVQNKRSKRTSKQNDRPEPVKGTSVEDPALKVAQRLVPVFVSGLSPVTESKNILEFLKNRNLEHGCLCDKMKTKKDKYQSSFKLMVPQEKKNVYMDPKLWPEGILVNHFRNIQSQTRYSNLRNRNSR